MATICGCIVIACPLQAQVQALSPSIPDASHWRTFGQVNGWFWRVADAGGKSFYLEGVREALYIAHFRALHTSCETDAKNTQEDLLPQSTATNAQIVEAIDSFYEDPANRLIPVVEAMEIVAARRRGVPDTVISDRILLRRRIALEAPEQK